MELLFQIGAMLVSVGAVYGLIRTDLKHLHEKAAHQHEVNKTLFTDIKEVDQRINDHIEHHHLRVK